ncbi:hypothetical protein HYC85_000403 [Camellia sinensis]|uniref:Uncharacterized protein n=1 Tax=Camellia sinensis TaxID=4442 RepID=A0A7J7I482_CAMSI|nr:hypothetical protein HYC85_000403 [Camellia sinensis]
MTDRHLYTQYESADDNFYGSVMVSCDRDYVKNLSRILLQADLLILLQPLLESSSLLYGNNVQGFYPGGCGDKPRSFVNFSAEDAIHLLTLATIIMSQNLGVRPLPLETRLPRLEFRLKNHLKRSPDARDMLI